MAEHGFRAHRSRTPDGFTGAILTFVCVLAYIGPLSAQQPDFSQTLYPILEAAQCRACHNDNGVASASRLRFPEEGASPDEITAFGLSLNRFVDHANLDASRLLRMPTNRDAHPGGERIRQGSPEERVLRDWIAHLAARSPSEEIVAAKAKAAPPVLRRLTHEQYNKTVEDLLEDRTRPARSFPSEDFVHGFTNQADAQSISPLLADDYNRAAAQLARNARRSGVLRKLIPCEPATPSDRKCAADFVRTFGKRAFRRPLDPAEAQVYESLLLREAARTGDFLNGAQVTLQAMLQSASFLFHTATGHYGAASRLSYLLWGSVPDEELMRAADEGRLGTPAEIEAAAKRLMDSPRARPALRDFVTQWLRFDRVRAAIRERKFFPEFGPELTAAMIEETSRFFEHLVWNDQDFREFFTAEYSFVNLSLAQLYELPPPEREFTMVRFPPSSRRAGILGHATFLTLTSKPEETSPTERGLFIREHFLCQVVPPPPAGVDTTLPALSEDRPMSNRERLAIHLSNPACSGCHRLVDPIGFGFEQFDAIGRYREKQIALVYEAVDKRRSGVRRIAKPVELETDTTASILGIPNSGFRSPAEAGRILADNRTCQRCIVKQFFRYALGRPESPSDQPAIDAILDRFRASGFRFRELILATVTSEPFLQEVNRAN